VNLFNAYARSNRVQKTPLNNLLEADGARVPRANGTCGTLVKKKGNTIIQPLFYWQYQQRARGGAPIRFNGLTGADLRVSRDQGAISWEGTYDTKSLGTGRVRLWAIKDTINAPWHLFYMDFCPDKPVSS